MFRNISYKIALQFMGFVFLLFLANGALFFVADFSNARRMSEDWLQRSSSIIQQQALRVLDGYEPTFPPPLRSRVRIVNDQKETMYEGDLFASVPMTFEEGTSKIIVQEEEYSVLTEPVMKQGQLVGYVQVAGIDRLRPGELPLRSGMYLLVSAMVSVLTFGVGLFFARRSLKPAEQMVERLEQFTQDASHELRTPITAVRTSIDLALIEKDNREYLLAAKEDLEDISRLIERLLELARLDKFALQTEPVNLQTIITETVEKYRPFAEERKITIKIDSEPVVVQGDHTLLRQAIGNLLSNAIKFNESKGHVTVRLTADELVMEDTGKGISKVALPHIFERFYQEDTSRSNPTQGFGLGLALVKRIVELHDWTIDVASKEAKGTIFTIHLS